MAGHPIFPGAGAGPEPFPHMIRQYPHLTQPAHGPGIVKFPVVMFIIFN
jgi:hypothetical protein